MTISKFEVDYCMNVILCNDAIMQKKLANIYRLIFPILYLFQIVVTVYANIWM